MRALRTSPAGFPVAPSVEEWESLSPTDRAAVVAELPGEVTDAEMSPPEGDLHFRAKVSALDALRGHFARQRRRIYLAAELPIYYPAEPRFAPDLIAVLDRDDSARSKWMVSAEGKGLDWVLEVHVGGDRKKDGALNVMRYGRLGIPEYFLYDRARNQLMACYEAALLMGFEAACAMGIDRLAHSGRAERWARRSERPVVAANRVTRRPGAAGSDGDGSRGKTAYARTPR